MDSSKQIIVVNGKDKTESIVSLQYHGSKCDVVFDNSSRVYSYNSSNVRITKLKQTIDPNAIIFKYKGSIIADIEQVRDFGEFYRVVRAGKKELSCKRTDVQISQNCLAEAESKELFQYFKDTATAVSLKTENGINILKLQYDKISAVDDCTALSRFLKPSLPVEKRSRTAPLIFPFGLNQSQKVAVENAFSSQVSIIQGPPGTGKTQTNLYIIANAVRNGKIVAVVSNNNSAKFSNIDYQCGFDTVDEELDFLEKVVAIEKHFGGEIDIPSEITEDDYRVIPYLATLVTGGISTGAWSKFEVSIPVTDELKERMRSEDNSVFSLSYVGSISVSLYNRKYELNAIKRFEAVQYQNLERLKQKVDVLDIGDDIKLTFLPPDGTEGKWSDMLDTLEEA